MIHTFPSCNLRAGRCVRSSLSEVPLGPQMYVSHCWHQLRVAQGPCPSTGRPPTGTFMLSGPIDQREATFRVAARSLHWQLPPSTGKHDSDQLNQAQINLVLDRLETIPSVFWEVQVFKEGTTGHWCDFAMMETLWDFSSCPGKTELW